MTTRAMRRGTWGLAVFLAALAACSSSDSPTAGPPSGSAMVAGLVVLQRDVAAGAPDALGVPPKDWTGQAADAAAFDRAVANADWSVDGVAGRQGVTDADGRFAIGGLAPGRYTLHISKTLEGNLLPLTIPFAVGADGSADLVVEVSWGLVRATVTYTKDGAQVQEVHGPYGAHLVIRDGHVAEIGDPSRTLTDANGDGQFEPQTCLDQLWDCGQDGTCADGRVCVCTASCPACDNCGPGVCVPGVTIPPTPAVAAPVSQARISPYDCSADGTCEQPEDQCICVASCPDCKDCARKVCVPPCAPVEITAVTISGPSQLVMGRQGQVNATALLSDGSAIDVTYLADWQSSDESVASVDSWGTVSANAIGTTSLTATVGTLRSAPWSLTVVDQPALQRITVQNQFCYCGPGPLAGPESGVSVRPCLLGAPARTDILPVPNCGQVVQIGSTLQFTAVGQYADGSYEDITKNVQWQVVPAEVGDVVAGLFTARQAGTAQLTAALGAVVSDPTEIRVVTQPTVVALSIYADNGVIAVFNADPVTGGIAVPCNAAPTTASLCCCPGPLDAAGSAPCGCGYSLTVLRGDQLKFHATAQYDTGDWRDVTDQVTWRSSNPAAGTIDATGVMTAVEAGDTTIDAVLDTIASNPVDVHVVDQATLLSISIYQEQNDRVVAKGDQRFFHATGYYDVGVMREVTSEATWHSSDDSVGGFDAPGVFTGRAAGTVEVWAELDGQQSQPLSLEVYQTSELTYCDPAQINRAVWSDNYNRVTLESDCATYTEPGVAALRYTVTEIQPHGGIFNPCLDLYVYQGKQLVRTIRQQGCGDPFLPAGASNLEETLKYQLLAFWDLKGDDGQPVASGDYTIYGRFYLYYDPVVSITVTVSSSGQALPTRTPTVTPGPVCTAPACGPGEVPSCPGTCPGGCGTVCVPTTPLPTTTPEGACFIGSSNCTGSGSPPAITLQSKCCLLFQQGELAAAISWCPADQFDPSTGQCAACASSPCEGLPVPPPSAA
jgi:hypothetical protein